MSVFHGHYGKGAMKAHRDFKRLAAEDRAAEFEQDVKRVMFEQHIGEREARRVAAKSRRIDRLLAEAVTR